MSKNEYPTASLQTLFSATRRFEFGEWLASEQSDHHLSLSLLLGKILGKAWKHVELEHYLRCKTYCQKRNQKLLTLALQDPLTRELYTATRLLYQGTELRQTITWIIEPMEKEIKTPMFDILMQADHLLIIPHGGRAVYDPESRLITSSLKRPLGYYPIIFVIGKL